jgi:acetone carboxylase alpha subunit
MRSKVIANHGMFGAYPTWPDRPSYAIGTNLKALIDARKPLVPERGDPEEPDLMKRVTAAILEPHAVAPFVTPALLHEYDLVIHPISGAQALGDPIERDPELVRADLDNGWTREWVAEGVHGVVARRDGASGTWAVDDAATARRRAEIREARTRRGVPFREWWRAERRKILAKEGMADAVAGMWRTSMALSPDYARELRAFWKLPEDFDF